MLALIAITFANLPRLDLVMHRVMQQAPPSRVNMPERKMVKNLWDSHLRIEEEVEKSIKLKHPERLIPIMAKVRDALGVLRRFNCLYRISTCIYMYGFVLSE